MKHVSILDLEIPSLSGESANRRPEPEGGPIVTDWKWAMEQAGLANTTHGHVQRILSNWDWKRTKLLGKQEWTAIRQNMEAFKHSRIYTLTLDDIMETVNTTNNAFGGTNKDDADTAGIGDATSKAPFLYILHSYIERNKDQPIPTWATFERHIRNHPQIYLEYIGKLKGLGPEIYLGDWLNHPIMRAVQYRLAAAYSSWIRELHFMTVLREQYGLPVRYHFMMDIEWKTDFICNGTCIELFLTNPKYKNKYDGRKIKCVDRNPNRNILEVTFDTRYGEGGTYNTPWLISRKAIEQTARDLENGNFTHRAKVKF